MLFTKSATLIGVVFTNSWSISLAQLSLPLRLSPSNGTTVNSSVNSINIGSTLDEVGDLDAIGSPMPRRTTSLFQKVEIRDVSATAKKRATEGHEDIVAKRTLERRVNGNVDDVEPLFSRLRNFEGHDILARADLAVSNIITRPDPQDSQLDQDRYENLERYIEALIHHFARDGVRGTGYTQPNEVRVWGLRGTRSPNFHFRFTYWERPVPLPFDNVFDIVHQLRGRLEGDRLGPFEMTIFVEGQAILRIELVEHQIPNPPPPPPPPPPNPPIGGTDRSAFHMWSNQRRVANRERQMQEEDNRARTRNTEAQNLGFPFVQPPINPRRVIPLYNLPSHIDLR